MKRVFILLSLMMITVLLSAQTPPDTLWTRTLGGSGDDYAQSVLQTSGGGFIITGYTNSFGAGNQDVWLIKTDVDGNDEWNQTFGGSHNDYAISIQQTSDTGYIMAGYTSSYGAGLLDFWLIKTDENGTEEWNQTFGGSHNDYAQSVQQTSDGGYIIAGYTESYGAGACDIWLIKIDSLGIEEWNYTFGGISNDRAFSVQQSSDGGYIIAGATTTAGDSDIWLIKTDPSGSEEWNQTFGQAQFEEAFSVQQTADAGYIIAGYSGSFPALDAWLIKTDSLGTEEWNNTYGGNNAEIAESVQQASDGGYIFTGLTESFGAGLFDLWIVKTDSAGNEEWDQTFGGYSNDIGYSVQQISEGEYVIAGCTSSYGVGGNDFWLIRLGQEVSIDENTAANSLISNLSNYPNPSRIGNEIKFNFRVGGLEGTARNVELKVYNILGELVAEVVNGERLVNNYTEIWRPDNLSNGVYFYQLKTENYREVKKMLITK